jgi:signal transduction histidine kinase
MGAFYQQISILLTTPPGSLTYHVVVLFSLVWAFQTVFSFWLGDRSPRLQRMIVGLCLLLALRVILFAAAFVGYTAPEAFLPPSERAVTVISLLIIVWLWVYPEGNRTATIVTLLGAILSVVFLAISISIWKDRSTELQFNSTLLSPTWEIIAAVVAFIGCLLLLIRHPDHWGIGFGMLGLNLAGHLLTILIPITEGDYPGIVRLVQMASYPMLFTLTQRIPSSHRRKAHLDSELELEAMQPYAENEGVRFTPKFFQEWLAMETAPSKENWHAVAHFIAAVMQAEYCLLISSPDNDGMMTIISTYHTTTDQFTDNLSLDAKQIPLLSNALQRGRALNLPAENKSQDLTNLKQILTTEENGHILGTPVSSDQEPKDWGIILFRPEKGWTENDQTQLTYLSKIIGEKQSRSSHKREAFQPEGEQALQGVAASSSLEKLENELRSVLQETQMQNKTLKKALDKAERDAQKVPTLEKEEKELRASLTETRTIQKQLQTALSKAKTQDERKTQEIKRLEKELRIALASIDQLKNRLSQTEQSAIETREQISQLSSQQTGEIASAAQELRYPMSAVVDYSDLLLDESVGALGALQRKFLEKIKESVKSLEDKVNLLIQSTVLDSSKVKLFSRTVDIRSVVDTTLTMAKEPIHQKNIRVNVNIPTDLPNLLTDREALHQIFLLLIRHATIATPPEGKISINIQVKSEDNQKSLLMQISDTGEGIPQEELPQVFSPLYRPSRYATPDGEAEMGLSITKTLVDALKGRIWVDSEEGKGSTFSVLLPFIPAEAQDKENV